MTIDELDEFQGMTPDMVRRWLSATGQPERECPKYQVCQHLGAHTHHGIAPMDFSVAEDWSGHWQRVNVLSVALWYIAATQGKTMQSLLREINPRMRKGMPSQAARDTHAGLWVGHMGGEFPSAMIGYWYDDGRFTAGMLIWDACKVAEAAAAKYPCAFWPCDENGNKVRWPTDAQGNML